MVATNANYFFIDGSALLAQVRYLQRSNPDFRRRKLDPRKLIIHFMNWLGELHGGSYKRATFYFPRGDEATVGDYLLMPDHRSPGHIRDIHFKFCGHKLKKSAEFQAFVEENVPNKFQGRFAKSEKGIDIQICCDALSLASSARLDRLFLFTNDSDFLPLCQSLKDFGANISILHLSDVIEPNVELLSEADSYDVVDSGQLDGLFFPGKEELASVNPTSDQLGQLPQSEKPDAAPSDLRLASEEDSPTDD